MSLQRILETSIYHDAAQRQEMESFYAGLLELPRVAGWPDGLAFRLGDGVLLVFDRELIRGREEPMAQHGSSGPGHVCLVDSDDYEDWKRRIGEAGVEITHEHEWDGGRRSFYFTDPAGNLVEIADGDLWPPAPAD
jgi:catechol 2,3-dioxygenase-like lactoylglutathione lyase family enzyme